MFEEFEAQIREEATAAYPNEAVWLITERGCKQVDNIHENPLKFFEVRPKDLAKARAEGLLAVVHSHPDMDDVPSASDMQAQINNDVPFGVLSSGSESSGPIRWWGMKERSPLLGRPFVHGITDCYAMIRDFYFMELGIDLPEFPRDWMWWNEDLSMFQDNFVEAGFREVKISEAKPHDVLLFKIRAPVTNHGGVLLDNDLFIHQMGTPSLAVDHSRPSAREPVSRYMSLITHVLRHRDLETAE